MAKFNNLSEGEKFAWSKDFLIKFRIIQKLRPELTEERDVLTLVAKKFYDENIEELEECIKFIESKVPISSLANVNLEPAVEEYTESLKKKHNDARDETRKGYAEEEKKKLEFEQHSRLKAFYDNKVNAEEKRQKRSERTRTIGKVALLAFAVMALVGMGGFIGVGNAILGFISNLTSIQAVTIGLVVIAGWNKGWLKGIKGKMDGRKKARLDKNKKRFDSFKAERDACGKEHEGIVEQFAKARTSKQEREKAEKDAKHEYEVESVHLSKYKKITDLDKALMMGEVEIKDQYERAKMQYDSEDEKKNLDKWREHYTAALYYGTLTGAIRNRGDLDALVQNSKNKFKQLSNPLNANRAFTEENVRAQTDSGINKPIEEMFESI